MAKQTLKVLIVDDDQFLLDMYSVKFKEEGIEVETSESGAEALAKLREEFEPDVLLMDVVMPDVDGLELLDTIKKEKLGGSPALVVLSNQGQPSDIEKAKKLGANDYIVKASAIPSEVLKRVVEIVEEHKKSK